MGLLNSIACLSLALSLCLAAIAFGNRILQLLHLRAARPFEQALFAAGVSFALLQVVVLALAVTGVLQRKFVLCLLFAVAILAGTGWAIVIELLTSVKNLLASVKSSKPTLICFVAVVTVIVLDGFMAMAPLNGSDAMHYHFVAPALWLRSGFKPLFSTTLSFATGQSHMLVLFGMALGSDRIAMGLIFVGGLLTAGSLYVLAREWLSPEWSLLAGLSFLLTPMVFWQMTVSGAPDIWMAFYTTLAVLAAARSIPIRSSRLAMLAGLFAGAAAGSKFTAWPIPASVILILLVEWRSLRPMIASTLAALMAGTGCILRNYVWTGDPFFPFLTRSLIPHSVNAYALAAVLADTRPAASYGTSVSWLAYPFLLVLRGDDYGAGHYFGPLVLCFAPLLILAYRPTPLFRIAACVWGGMLLCSIDPPQMARFLLPVFPVALAVSFAGVASVALSRVMRLACGAAIAAFLLFGVISFGIYAKNFLPVTLGLESQEQFLRRAAPQYQEAEFINRTLEGKPGSVLVFLRYTYYIRVNYTQGDPLFSWEVDPEKLRTPGDILDWLRRSGVRWVARTGPFPAPLRSALETLQADGTFHLVAAAEVESFEGFRIDGRKVKVPVEIFELAPPNP